MQDSTSVLDLVSGIWWKLYIQWFYDIDNLTTKLSSKYEYNEIFKQLHRLIELCRYVKIITKGNKDFMVHIHAIPQGYHSVNPYIVINNINKFILFLQSVFGAIKKKEVDNNQDEHYAEVMIGDTCIMIEENKNVNMQKGTYLWIYVQNVNSIYNQALAAGCLSLEPPQLKYGVDFVAKVIDPFGIVWLISSYNSGS